MSKMKDKYFDIIDKLPQDKWDRGYELSNLIEFTEWSIKSDKNDLKNYIKEFNDLFEDAETGSILDDFLQMKRLADEHYNIKKGRK